jgi:predicted nucleic acid-binding protein
VVTIRAHDQLVVDASAMVDLLTEARSATAVHERLQGTTVHSPAHLDAEVLSALGRMYRADELSATTVQVALERFAVMPVNRHPLAELLVGAWARRDSLRLVDALYVELAARLHVWLVTLDGRLARACPFAEAVREG